MSLYKEIVWHSRGDPILATLHRAKKKKPTAHPSPKAKNFTFKPKNKNSRKSFFFSKFIRTNQTKTKSKSLFSSHFSFKIAFKPNKSQESQVSSQDHHNQNGENPLKKESIQH